MVTIVSYISVHKVTLHSLRKHEIERSTEYKCVITSSFSSSFSLAQSLSEWSVSKIKCRTERMKLDSYLGKRLHQTKESLAPVT